MLGIHEYLCSNCKKPKLLEEMNGTDDDLCIECHDAWCKTEIAFWRPRYEGEKLAGLIPDKNQLQRIEDRSWNKAIVLCCELVDAWWEEHGSIADPNISDEIRALIRAKR